MKSFDQKKIALDTKTNEKKANPAPKPPPYKEYASFGSEYSFYPSASFTHNITEITKPPKLKPNNKDSKRDTKKWIAKRISDKILERAIQAAQAEVLAQEFFRLFINHQPKTRLQKNPNGSIYILSEKIPNFYTGYNDEMIFDARTDLAEILIISLFLNEYDLKWGNIGFSNGRLKKIDGELCFMESRLPNDRHDITADDLKNLPDVTDYTPSNWLWIIEYHIEMSITAKNTYLARRLKVDPKFRRHINLTILKIILLPDIVFETFIDCYLTDKTLASYYLKILIQRRNQLLKAALQLDSFLNYYDSAETEEDLNKFTNELKSFKTMGKYNLWDNISGLKTLIYNNHTILKAKIHLQNILWNSLKNRQFETVKKALIDNPNLDLSNELDNNNNTLLHIAIEMHADIDVVKLLCRAKHKINLAHINSKTQSALLLAAKVKNYDAVKYFINTLALAPATSQAQIGHAIFVLTKNGETQLANDILDKFDADLSVQNSEGSTTLHAYAIYVHNHSANVNFPFIKRLLHYAPNIINIENEKTATFLSIACAKASLRKVAQYIIETPSLLKQFNENQLGAALYILVQRNEYEIACMLLRNTDNININYSLKSDKDKDSILHLALLQSPEPNFDFIDLLIQNKNLGCSGKYTYESNALSIAIERMGNNDSVKDSHLITTMHDDKDEKHCSKKTAATKYKDLVIQFIITPSLLATISTEVILIYLIIYDQNDLAIKLIEQCNTHNIERFPVATPENLSSLHLAINSKIPNIRLIKLLCKTSFYLCPEFTDPIRYAISLGKFELIECLITNLNYDRLKLYSRQSLSCALCELLILKKLDLVKILIKAIPDIDINISSEQSTNNRIIHLMIENNLDIDTIRSLSSTVYLGIPNNDNETELDIAIRMRNYNAIRLFLEIGFYAYIEKKRLAAFRCLLEETPDIRTKLYIPLSKCIRNPQEFVPKLVDKQHRLEFTEMCILLINTTKTVNEVLYVIDALTNEEKQTPFLNRPTSRAFVVTWDGTGASNQWYRIILHAKQRIIEITKKNNVIDHEEKALAFLKKPTTTWSRLFTPSEANEYIKICNTIKRKSKGAVQADFKHAI